MAQIVETAGERTRSDDLLGPIKERIEQAKRDRARFEPAWHSNRAFGAGKQWLKWSRADRRLKLNPADVAGGRERHTADILTQNLWTALGQFGALIGERRSLQFRREDVPSEDFTEAANDALAYLQDVEVNARKQLWNIARKLMIDGTAALQCYFDPAIGKELGEMPLRDGTPIYDGEQARSYVAELAEQGQTAEYKLLNEGRICWHPRSVFQLLVPPGIEDEEHFPWEAIIEAVPIDALIERFGERAQGLNEEPLAVLEQIGLKDSIDSGFGADPEGDPGTPGKLDGHAALISYYERPSRRYPRGRCVYYAGQRVLEVTDQLPYRTPRGDYCSGLVYFHYWRVEGRFWGRGLIEPGKGIQRIYNRRTQQEHMTIDRGQPKVLLDEATEPENPQTDIPLEIIKYKAGAGPPPTVMPGVEVSQSLWRSKEGLLADLERGMGVHAVSTGEAPTRQTTYAELALRSEKDQVKLDPIRDDFNEGVDRVIELSCWDIRKYWSQEKLIALAGEEGQAEAVRFKGEDLPDFFLVERVEGGAPVTQAANLQLIAELWAADQAMAAAGDQRLDLDWLANSYKARKPLDFPESPKDTHQQKARWENTRLLAGEDVEPSYFDPIDVHIPAHREAQVEAQMANDLDAYQRIEVHVQWHMHLFAEEQEKQANIQAQGAAAQAEVAAGQEQQAAAQEQQGAEADHQRQLELEQERQAGRQQQSQQ